MRKLIAAIILTLTSGVSVAEDCEVDFTTNQLHVLQRAFDAGRERDWSWSLAAIAWRESSAGVQLVRFEPPYRYENASYGVFHIYLKTAMAREECDNRRCAAVITQKLMKDFDYAAKHAMAELDYWKRLHGSDFLDVWRGYNDGFKGSPKGFQYADEIRERIVYLKKCVSLE